MIGLPPGIATDFRGNLLKVGDLVAASMGGRYHSLSQRLVIKLTPKTAMMVKVSAVRSYEREKNVTFTKVADLLKVNWQTQGYGDAQRRGFEMIARLGDFTDFVTDKSTIKCTLQLHHGKHNGDVCHCKVAGPHAVHQAHYYRALDPTNPRGGRRQVLGEWTGKQDAYTDAKDDLPALLGAANAK
jgi:hypothetical protein